MRNDGLFLDSQTLWDQLLCAAQSAEADAYDAILRHLISAELLRRRDALDDDGKGGSKTWPGVGAVQR